MKRKWRQPTLLFLKRRLKHDKTWPEQVHRLLATSLGLFCIAFVVMAYRQRQKGFNAPIKLTLVLLAMVIVQGMFGRWTVTLNLWPQVVTAHLIGGFTTLSLLWLLTLRLQKNRRWQMTPHVFAEIQRLKPLLLVTLGVVIVQILLGGWTSTNYAALACPDLPTCQGQWWPNMDFTKGFNFAQDIGPNYLGA